MTRTNMVKLGCSFSRAIHGRVTTSACVNRLCTAARASTTRSPGSRPLFASFSTKPAFCRPVPAEALKTAQPADITEDEYHKLADQYIDDILVRFEEEQDAKDEIDVDYSAGVMNIKYSYGTYVINKQPPNKQIWLSSPISGPKRYDYVVTSEGQNSKQDTATSGWVYLRDGTYLNEILQQETGVSLNSLDEDAVESL